MYKTKLFAMASVLALLVSPLATAKPPQSAQACWQPAFEAGNADAVAKCYAPDAVLWLPGAPMMKGHEAIRAGYAGYFKDYKIKSMKLAPMGKTTMGNNAASWGTFTLVTVSKTDGKETTEMGRYTDVTRRIGGQWLYIVDHASDDPASPPAK